MYASPPASPPGLSSASGSWLFALPAGQVCSSTTLFLLSRTVTTTSYEVETVASGPGMTVVCATVSDSELLWPPLVPFEVLEFPSGPPAEPFGPVMRSVMFAERPRERVTPRESVVLVVTE